MKFELVRCIDTASQLFSLAVQMHALIAASAQAS